MSTSIRLCGQEVTFHVLGNIHTPFAKEGLLDILKGLKEEGGYFEGVDECFRTFSEHFQKIAEDFRREPKISEEGPMMFRSYNNTSEYFLRDYVAIECFHCHAIKNKIKNHSVDKVKK